MSEASDHDMRLTAVERALSGQGAELARQGTRLDGIERDISKVLAGLETIAKDRAAAPQPISWKVAGATLISLAAAGSVIWQIIAMAPVVTEIRDKLATFSHASQIKALETELHLEKRLIEVDGKHGRISHIEAELRRINEALRWAPTIARTQ